MNKTYINKQRLTKVVTIKFAQEDWDNVIAEAYKEKMPVSVFVRKVILDEIEDPRGNECVSCGRRFKYLTRKRKQCSECIDADREQIMEMGR